MSTERTSITISVTFQTHKKDKNVQLSWWKGAQRLWVLLGCGHRARPGCGSPRCPEGPGLCAEPRVLAPGCSLQHAEPPSAGHAAAVTHEALLDSCYGPGATGQHLGSEAQSDQKGTFCFPNQVSYQALSLLLARGSPRVTTRDGYDYSTFSERKTEAQKNVCGSFPGCSVSRGYLL